MNAFKYQKQVRAKLKQKKSYIWQQENDRLESQDVSRWVALNRRLKISLFCHKEEKHKASLAVTGAQALRFSKHTTQLSESLHRQQGKAQTSIHIYVAALK